MKPQEAKGLARAAAAYGGYSRNLKALAEASGLSLDQVRRMVAPSDDRYPNLEERIAIGRACGVPRALMEEGFSAVDGGGDAALKEMRDRLDTLESKIDSEATERGELQRRIDALEVARAGAASGGS